MNGLDCMGADDPSYVGFDYMSLLKGAGGMMSGFGGGQQQGQLTPQQMMEQQRLRDAERSASTMKMILVGVAALVGVGGIAYVVSK